MRSLLYVSFLIAIAFNSTQLIAQNSSRQVYVDVDVDRKGVHQFYTVNQSYAPYTIKVDFNNVQNAIPPRNPYYTVAQTGRSLFLRLRKSGAGSGPVRYRYSYTRYRGCYDAEPDKDVEYLLPVGPDKSVQISSLTSLKSYDPTGSKEREVIGHAYRVGRGDTVYAVRKGRITLTYNGSEDESKNVFNRDQNWLEIVHEDCTFARYRQLKKGTITVEPGDEVNPGDPLAVVANAENEGDEFFNIRYSYSNLKSIIDKGKDPSMSNPQAYFVPDFRTANGSKVKLKSGDTYHAVHPEEVITQEMNRRERRRYRRRN
ncbi:hypothetical protein AB2B38_007375 [Balneola sp. MJW-20]|uniref:hypothetical protein n=1 Tax=Gracilimonas aurantiaca TaxID=3234185 RepID=UPI0034660D43